MRAWSVAASERFGIYYLWIFALLPRDPIKPSDPNAALTLQLLEWIASDRRTSAEVLDAWRTTCPRLSIWEDACMDGLIDREPDSQVVTVSPKGRLLLEQCRTTGRAAS